VANTFLHVSRLEWAGPMTVYVLDDSARESVRELAWEHGFCYPTRPNR
jgi:cellulose synthase (UDP-forming)